MHLKSPSYLHKHIHIHKTHLERLAEIVTQHAHASVIVELIVSQCDSTGHSTKPNPTTARKNIEKMGERMS